MYIAKVQYYDEDERKTRIECCLCGGSRTYSEAMLKVADVYGEENIIEVTLQNVEDFLFEEEVADLFTNFHNQP